MSITRKAAAAVLALCAAGLTVFYFFDLTIAQAVYRPDTAFGSFFDITAPCIAPLLGAFLLTCLWGAGRGRVHAHPAALWAELLLAAACVVIFVVELNQYAGLWLGWPVRLVIAASALLALVVVTACIHVDYDALRRLTICAVVMIAAVFVMVYGLKIVWGRRRFFTMDDPAAQFTRWLFPQGGGHTEAYRSFPSGHTANGCAILLLLLFPRAFPALRRVRPAIVVFELIWIPLMAFSRMVEGAHFASDVTMGFTIAFAVFLVVSSAWFDRLLGAHPRSSAAAQPGAARCK